MVEFKQIGERIALVRKNLGYKTQKDFAQKIGIAWRTLQTYEQGKFKKIPYGFIETLEKQFNVSKNWIETGQGEMFKKDEEINDVSPEIKELVENFSKLSPKKQKYFLHKIIAEALEEELKKDE